MISTTLDFKPSQLNDFEASINFHVIDSITNKLPTHTVKIHQLNILDTIINCLADPGFHEPRVIDVLRGAEIFYDLFTGESKKAQDDTVFHYTSLGWVLTGSVPIANPQMSTSSLFIQCPSISSLVLSSCPTCSIKRDAQVAQVHFTSTVTQDESGRFVV